MSNIQVGDTVIDTEGLVAEVFDLLFFANGTYAAVRYFNDRELILKNVHELQRVDFEPKSSEESEPKKSEEEPKFEFVVGGVVQLKSGGPRMTVSDIPKSDSEKKLIRAMWYRDESGEYLADDFFDYMLVKIDSQA